MTKRETIIKTALRLFNERGFDNTPTSLIAKEAGVSVGTLFNNFETKEVLIKELYLCVKQNMKDHFMGILDLNHEEVDIMKEIWRTIIKWNIDNKEEFKFMGQFKHSPYINKIDHDIESYKKYRDFVLKFVSGRDICNKFPEFSFVYISSIINSTTEYIENNHIEEVDDFIDMTFDLFWNGFNNRR